MDIYHFVMTHEMGLRGGLFLGVLLLVGLWEVIAPRRTLTVSKGLRWFSNLSIVVLNSMMLRLGFPVLATGVAAFGVTHGWGLFNYVQAPGWLALPVSVIALDFMIWLQHVMVHAVPALWRLHRVHHADPDYDVTTGSRFHPIEIALSMMVKFATIIVLGVPVLAVVIVEILLNASAMFNHGNIRVPDRVDRVLRRFVVTPDMHRVHHSIEADETNTNFGFNLPWWDRLFGTYRAQPRAGHEAMTIGIQGHRDPQEVARLNGMLMLPFRGESGDYVITRRDQAARHPKP